MTIKTGSVVTFKSGGPLMVAGEIEGRGRERTATCAWFPKVNGGDWATGATAETFPLSVLEEADVDDRVDAFNTKTRLLEVEAERDALRAVGLAVCDQLLGEDLDPADLERLLKLQTLCTPKAVA